MIACRGTFVAHRVWFLTESGPIKVAEHASKVKRSPPLGEQNEEAPREVPKFCVATSARLPVPPRPSGVAI